MQELVAGHVSAIKWLCHGSWFQVSAGKKQGGRQAVQGWVCSHGCLLGTRSCAGPCDGAPRMGVVGGASPGNCALLRLSCGLCPHRVLFQPSSPYPALGQVTVWFLHFLTVESAPVATPIHPLEALILLESNLLKLSSFFFVRPTPDLTQHLCFLLRLFLSRGEERMCPPSICSPPMWDQQEHVDRELRAS